MDAQLEWKLIENVSLASEINYWKGVLLSVVKPHVINRRLAGAEQVAVFRSGHANIDAKLIGQRVFGSQDHVADSDINAEFLKKIIDEFGGQFDELDSQHLATCDFYNDRQTVIILNKLLPKNMSLQKCTFEVVLLGR